jgi:DNA-binding YbaB/EbfC family protein
MDFSALLGKFQEMQGKMETEMAAVRQELASLTATGDAGAGMVTATVNGQRQVLKVNIDSEIMNDKEMVEDLVCAAVNRALEKIEAQSREKLAALRPDTSLFKDLIPGNIDLSKFGL